MARRAKTGSFGNLLFLLVLVVGLAVVVFAVTAKIRYDQRSKASETGSKIYWGARMDGEVYGLGDAPWDDTTWARFETDAGKRASIVHWGSTYPETFSQNAGPLLQKVRSRGAIPMVTWSTASLRLRDITSGNYDTFFQSWASAAAASRIPFFLRFDWEMNGGWYQWGTISGNSYSNTPADYVNMWRHVHDIFSAAGAANVTWVWCPNSVYSTSTPLSQIYPGDAYVDWTCFDSYNWGDYKGGWQSFYQIVKPTYDQLLQLAPNKPILIGETASSETGAPSGSSKAAWITDALVTELPVMFPQIKALVWFNWNILENGQRLDWPIESTTTAQSAFAVAIASSYYATNEFSTVPLGQPIAPLTAEGSIPPANSPTPTTPVVFSPTAAPSPSPTPIPSSAITVSNVTVGSISSSSGIVSWTTSTPSTSQINYGLSNTNLSWFTTKDMTLVGQHSQTINNLSRNTRYYYKVVSEDGAGHAVSSAIYSFRTRPH